MRRRACIIVNPASGQGRAGRMADELERLLAARGAEVACQATRGAGDARRHAAAAAPSADVLLSVGGDGTLNEVLNGVVDAASRTPVAVVPTGTANVVHKELGLPRALDALAEIAWAGRVREVDLGACRSAADGAGRPSAAADSSAQRRFALCAGAGFDAEVVRRVSRERTGRGITLADYYRPALGTAWRYAFPRMRVWVDGQPVAEDATFVLVSNTNRYGGPFAFFQQARMDDGLLDVCYLVSARRWDLVRAAWGAFWRRMPVCERMAYAQGRSVRVEAADAKDAVPVQIDGDVGGFLPLEIEVLAGAAALCVGPA